MNTLVIGDIHGCWDELQELIDQAALGSDDMIISVGDMVDRGPESPRVLRFFRDTHNTRAIMGNHERKHLRSWRGETEAASSQLITRLQFGDDYPAALDYMETLPKYLELPQADLVHGFFGPGVPLDQQRDGVIIGTMSGETYLDRHLARLWYELYDGDKPLIVGHRDYLRTKKPLLYPTAAPRVYGLDTGCVYGGALTGLILSEFRLISVASRRNYWEELQAQYSHDL